MEDTTAGTGTSHGLPSSILRRNSGGARRNSGGTGGIPLHGGPQPKRTSWADHKKRRNSSYSGVSAGSSDNSYSYGFGAGPPTASAGKNYSGSSAGADESRSYSRTGVGSQNAGNPTSAIYNYRQQRHFRSREHSASASQHSRDSSDITPTRKFGSTFFQDLSCRCCGCVCRWTLSKGQIDILRKVRKHMAYQILLGISIVILLFGSQVQDLITYSVETVDLTFNILFLVVFVVLSLDMILLCLTRPNYFMFNFSSPTSQHSIASGYDEEEDIFGGFFGFFKMGSLMFWIDLISTISLFYDITFVNPLHGRVRTLHILVSNGDITGGGLRTNRFALNPDWNFLISVVRSVRVIRYVRTISSILRGEMVRTTMLRICNFCGLTRYLPRSLRCCGHGPTRGRFGSISMTGDEHIPSAVTLSQSTIHSTQRSDQSVSNTGRNLYGRRTSQRNPSFASSVQSSNSKRSRRNHGSQLGQRMKDLTSKRVALFIALAIVLTTILTYNGHDVIMPSTMVVLHNSISSYQNLNNATKMETYSLKILDAATSSTTGKLISYAFDGKSFISIEDDPKNSKLREREKLEITVCSTKDANDEFRQCEAKNGEDGIIVSVGVFSNRQERCKTALMTLLFELFIILIWFFGVNAFAGPVMTLIVDPIERMVRLLRMLVRDPLGYTNTSNYQQFVEEENYMSNTHFTKEICRGMETSFLMSTILRIGSLMKVGFGSAGVEIIREQLLEQGPKNVVPTSGSSGSTVSCIFLFCDIRQFTNATEVLQEEVFVFTNKIAAVVHSICHAYDGSANKNIGDAFLVSWLLKSSDDSNQKLVAERNEGDKALFSVVKICVALHHESFFLDSLTDEKKRKLKNKLSERPGPIVQMGFGLHAGKAVQGAIGSHRKLDATYVSKAVEMADYLEASTKKYGVKMLMSGQFHQLLDKDNQRRCRKVDQVTYQDDDTDEIFEINKEDTLQLYTFDMDVDALFDQNRNIPSSIVDTNSSDGSFTMELERRLHQPRPKLSSVRRWSALNINSLVDDLHNDGLEGLRFGEELELPEGPCNYNKSLWCSEEMKIIRKKYTDGVFQQKFEKGLNAYCDSDWATAKTCFEFILTKLFTDGPSQYFMKLMKKTNFVAPRNFEGFSPA